MVFKSCINNITNTNKYLNPMLKLEQIEILSVTDIIVEVMEPIVYTKAGTVLKSDETVAKEKANVFYTVATVVKVHEDIEVSKNTPKLGDNIIVPRNQIQPIQFPVEGYDAPRLGVINTYTPFARIKDEL